MTRINKTVRHALKTKLVKNDLNNAPLIVCFEKPTVTFLNLAPLGFIPFHSLF